MASAHDPCFMYTPSLLSTGEEERAAVGLQTEDTFYAGTAAFNDKEKRMAKRFLNKLSKILGPNSSLIFNGAVLQPIGTDRFLT